MDRLLGEISAGEVWPTRWKAMRLACAEASRLALAVLLVGTTEKLQPRETTLLASSRATTVPLQVQGSDWFGPRPSTHI